MVLPLRQADVGHVDQGRLRDCNGGVGAGRAERGDEYQ
jgi:hypothetical protein